MHASQHILVDLDSLLDTRLGCLITRKPVVAAKIDMDKYRGRLTDNLWELWPEVTEEEWRAWWSERDVNVLMNSLATPIMMRLKSATFNLKALQAKETMMTDLKVIINTYPYRLTDRVAFEYREAIKDICASGFVIESVYMPPEELTPSKLMDAFNYCIMYDFDKWLTVNHEALTKKPIPSFPMNVPSLYRNSVPGEADIKELGLSTPEEAFAQWELFMSAHLMLGFLPISEYSQIL